MLCYLEVVQLTGRLRRWYGRRSSLVLVAYLVEWFVESQLDQSYCEAIQSDVLYLFALKCRQVSWCGCLSQRRWMRDGYLKTVRKIRVVRKTG